MRVGARVSILPSYRSVNAPVSDVRVRCPWTYRGASTHKPAASSWKMTAERIFDVLGHFKRYEKLLLICPFIS